MKYKLTTLEKLQMHRLMWLWISENEERFKDDWWLIYENDIPDCTEDCFLCETFLLCSDCPLQHRGGCCYNKESWFKFWSTTHNPAYARRIAHCADALIKKLEAVR